MNIFKQYYDRLEVTTAGKGMEEERDIMLSDLATGPSRQSEKIDNTGAPTVYYLANEATGGFDKAEMHFVPGKTPDEKDTRIAQLQEALGTVEWVWHQKPFGYWCPLCGNSKNHGHRPDCIIGIALRGEE